MKTVSNTQAQADLPSLLERTAAAHEPIQVTGSKASAVPVVVDDWLSIKETLYLLSVPEIRQSIQEAMRTSADECSTELSR